MSLSQLLYDNEFDLDRRLIEYQHPVSGRSALLQPRPTRAVAMFSSFDTNRA
ncbi:MAG: hypothetical protein JOY78_05930 [Pseudonocardia sp.]|nr:hypothetical protein [Pseudonocardia sp.]